MAALVVAVAIFPARWLGSWAEFLPPGNPLGPAGERVRDALVGLLGAGSAAVPLCVLAAAASLGKWGSANVRKRSWILAVALVFLLPATAYLMPPLLPDATCPPTSHRASVTGFLGGRMLGSPLCGAVGWLGASLLAAAGWIALSVASFGFNPVSVAAAGATRTAKAVGRATRRTASGISRGATDLGERRARSRDQRRARSATKRAKKQASATATGSAPEAAQAALGGAPAQAADAAASGRNDGAPWETALEGSDVASGPIGSGSALDQPAGSAPTPGETGPSSPPEGHPQPPIELLTLPEYRDRLDMERELDRLGTVLVETLQTFNIQSEIKGRTTGPVVTQFEVVPAAGVKVNRITNLDADLALAMKARSVRIVAPIPGMGAVGVEIPNPQPEMVRLREILNAEAFAGSRAALPLALGKDLTGRPYVADLTKMPHALIAGATGSGKSVCLNTIITSLIYRHGPDRLRLLLIDPKMVELSAYGDLPHLRHPVVTDPKDAAGILKWAVLEMERRYALLSANGVRSLEEFNGRVNSGAALRRSEPRESFETEPDEEEADAWLYDDGPLPYIVVVVDELADLMMTVQAEVEKPLTQLAQKARAIGIHLLVATQRPSVNVITGLIKANFPCRIAFRVASKTDSRTILDQNGADSLLGHGDMLFLPPGQSEPVRMQGAFISTEETEALMTWYREQADTLEALKARVTQREEDILEAVREAENAADDEGGGPIRGDWDELFREAAQVCIQNGGGSTSLLQRRLRIGYGRAARIVDQLHDVGVLGPPDGSKPREVLVGPDGLDEICPS